MNQKGDSPRGLLADELSLAEPDIDLARAALLIAKEEYPQLSVELYLARFDQIAEEVKDRLSDESAPLLVLQEMLETLYERRSFGANRQAYYDPRNSFLNDVLDRGVGIPLTLGMVVLEVGWRLGLPLEGVNFPGHFLVRYRGEVMDLLVDPFDGGKIRFEDQAQELLDRAYGGVVRLQPSFLRVASRRDMLVRMLTNLKGVYMRVGDDERALAAVERILMLTPTAPAENRSRGLLLVRLGRRNEAAKQLEKYLRVAPGASDADRVEDMLRDLKAGRDPADVEGL
ncbi:MAG: tetratricopeptide repeat protein [Gemmatimonadota bacterium]|nr:tetratricopeptide repeat protein [Gemmatimonadota bacterium]